MPIDYFCEFEDCCAYCGGPYQCDDHVRAYSKGGVYTVPCCSECNGNKYNKALRAWLREVKAYWPQKWYQIIDHHYGKRNWLSQIVHQVYYE